MADKLISADALRQRMYHDAFETDTEMQRWDSGCWIRYKMFENALEDAPTVDAVEVVRCKDCKWASACYGDIVRASKGGGEVHIPLGTDGYCSRGERREDETD